MSLGSRIWSQRRGFRISPDGAVPEFLLTARFPTARFPNFSQRRGLRVVWDMLRERRDFESGFASFSRNVNQITCKMVSKITFLAERIANHSQNHS